MRALGLEFVELIGEEGERVGAGGSGHEDLFVSSLLRGSANCDIENTRGGD
jgi:hypothetical protein